jgi:hypothetical protein
VARHLAAERRALLTHARLEERVADAVDQRRAARARDGIGHGAACANVVQDRGAGLLLENRLRE